MSVTVYADELAQSFVSNGNVFLKFRHISGDVDPTGQDLKVETLTLILPISCLGEVSQNLLQAQQIYCADMPPMSEQSDVEEELIVGPPITIPR